MRTDHVCHAATTPNHASWVAILAVLLGVLIMMSGGQAQTLYVSLYLSDDSSPYRQFADSLKLALAASKADVHIAEVPNSPVDVRRLPKLPGARNADLIVAVGTKAAELCILQVDTPVLIVMVPDTGYQKMLARETLPPVSAIYLNQSWDRQFDFLRATFPERRKIGMLYSPDTRIDIESLRKKLAARGGTLIARPVKSADSLYAALESVLADSAVLLAIPDSTIYSSSNFRNILLTSYRRNVPLVGISKAYVNAGAVCAIFATPEQMGEQAGGTIVLFAQNRQLPAPQYPAAFAIEANRQVAGAMGLILPTQDEIRAQMNQGAGR